MTDLERVEHMHDCKTCGHDKLTHRIHGSCETEGCRCGRYEAPEPADSCATCRSWLPPRFDPDPRQSNSGDCRRYPPTVMLNLAVFDPDLFGEDDRPIKGYNFEYIERHPRRHASNWCGEYKRGE